MAIETTGLEVYLIQLSRMDEFGRRVIYFSHECMGMHEMVTKLDALKSTAERGTTFEVFCRIHLCVKH